MTERICPQCHGVGWRPIGDATGSPFTGEPFARAIADLRTRLATAPDVRTQIAAKNEIADLQQAADAVTSSRPRERCDCWREHIGRQHLAAAAIPANYRHCTLENFNAYTSVLKRAREKVRRLVEAFPLIPTYPDAKGGLFLQGLPGVGKTHLAVAALTGIIARTKARGLFYDTRDLLRLIRDSYNAATKTTETQVLRPVLEAELLVLDDLGAERTTEWVEETMNFIVNTRYSQCRRTIFTTNYQDGPDETDPLTLVCRIGSRMRSRIAEMCEFIDLDGADYRHMPPDSTDRQLIASGEARPKSLHDLKRPRPARAQLRQPAHDGPADLKWPGGKGGNI